MVAPTWNPKRLTASLLINEKRFSTFKNGFAKVRRKMYAESCLSFFRRLSLMLIFFSWLCMHNEPSRNIGNNKPLIHTKYNKKKRIVRIRFLFMFLYYLQRKTI